LAEPLHGVARSKERGLICMERLGSLWQYGALALLLMLQ